MGTPPAIWRSHAGSCLKVVTWAASATGGVPEIPSTDTGTPNEVLLDWEISPEVPGVGIGGDPCWVIAGVYTYLMQTPPRPAG